MWLTLVPVHRLPAGVDLVGSLWSKPVYASVALLGWGCQLGLLAVGELPVHVCGEPWNYLMLEPGPPNV